MRFSEMDSMNSDQLDFVPRGDRNQIFKLILAFVLTIAVIFVLAYAPLGLELYAPLLAIVLVAVLCLYTVASKQISMDKVMSAEYQLMLFSQAATLNASFCLFVRRDGTIVFANDGLSRVFPHFDYSQSQALEGLFAQSNVRKVDRERILGALLSNSSDHIIFPIEGLNGESKDYIVTVDPLTRPSGFCVIRGREYLGQRAGAQRMPDMLRSTSLDKLEHLLTTSTAAQYVTDNFGKFEYANPAFAALLGYAPGDILDAKLSLHHLVVTLGEQVMTEEYMLSDYSGEASLLHRNGSYVQATLSQSALRDAAGKVIGATGTLAGQAA
ncbi:MAG: PAS domain-containing protein [Pseudomonadota bacterium]